MAFNAFTAIAVTGAPGDVVAKGKSVPAHTGKTQIQATVVARADQNKQCTATADDPNADPWTVKIPNPKDDPFESGEEVYVIGSVQDPDRDEPFMWVNELTIAPKVG